MVGVAGISEHKRNFKETTGWGLGIWATTGSRENTAAPIRSATATATDSLDLFPLAALAIPHFL